MLAANYVNRRSTDEHVPTYRARLSVAQPANHENMDVRLNFKRLHAPVCQSSTVSRFGGNNPVILDRYNGPDSRTGRAFGEESDLLHPSRREEQGV